MVVVEHLLGAMCPKALSPSLFCLPPVPTVSDSGEAFVAEDFVAGVSRVFLRSLRPLWWDVFRVFWLKGGGFFVFPVFEAGQSHQQLLPPSWYPNPKYLAASLHYLQCVDRLLPIDHQKSSATWSLDPLMSGVSSHPQSAIVAISITPSPP